MDRNQDIGPALREKLLEILRNNQSVSLLKSGLAAIVDVGEHFVKSTYNLEGNGHLAVKCYEEIIKLRSVIQVAHYPNIEVVSHMLGKGDTLAQQQCTSYALHCVKDALFYFQSKFGDDLLSPLNAFKAVVTSCHQKSMKCNQLLLT